MVVQEDCVRIVEEDELMRNEWKRKRKDSWQIVEVGVNKLYGGCLFGCQQS